MAAKYFEHTLAKQSLMCYIYSFIRNKCRIKKKKRNRQKKIHIEAKLNEQNVSV